MQGQFCNILTIMLIKKNRMKNGMGENVRLKVNIQWWKNNIISKRKQNWIFVKNFLPNLCFFAVKSKGLFKTIRTRIYNYSTIRLKGLNSDNLVEILGWNSILIYSRNFYQWVGLNLRLIIRLYWEYFHNEYHGLLLTLEY